MKVALQPSPAPRHVLEARALARPGLSFSSRSSSSIHQRRLIARSAVPDNGSSSSSSSSAGASADTVEPPSTPQQQQQQSFSRATSPAASGSYDNEEVPVIGVSGIRKTRRARRTSSPANGGSAAPAAATPLLASSLASLSSLSSLDLLDLDDEDLTRSAVAIEEELAVPYELSPQQVHTIKELRDEMVGCSNAFFGVAVASIALSVAAAKGIEVIDAPEVLFSGVTVGDVASWVDSLLIAGLLRFGGASFTRVLDTQLKRKQLTYTFQGINRLGLVFQQLAVAASTVAIVVTLEAAVEWPPLVTVASGLFFGAAVLRSAAMWLVITKYGKKLDDVEEALEAQRRCVKAAASNELPLLDRLAIRVAFNYLLESESVGRRSTEQAIAEGGRLPAPLLPLLSTIDPNTLAAGRQRVAQVFEAFPVPVIPVIQRSGSGTPHGSGGGSGAFKGGSAPAGMSTEAAAAAAVAAAAAAAGAGGGLGGREEERFYELTQEEERLVQNCNNSINSAGLAFLLQAFATVLLVTASIATDDGGGAIADGIGAANKLIAAELIFVATANFDRALYEEGCDVEHLLQGLGQEGLTKLFNQLAILAWAVVAAKGISLAAPWEESSPFFTYLNEVLGHSAGDMLLEAEQLLVKLLP